MAVKLSVRGVRGALPIADGRFLEYGGNTSCFCLEWDGRFLCFDAGSGLAGSLPAGAARADILISHLHVDHILGLYHLGVLRGPEIHLYGGGSRGNSFREQLHTMLSRPYWPVDFENVQADIHIHEIKPGERVALPGAGDGVRVFTMGGNHPDGSILYRVQIGEINVVYALDCEMSEEMFSLLTQFAKGCSLLIWDANFTRADKRPGWGHSTWEEGIAAARAAGAKQILMTHYSREYTDDFLRKQEKLAAKECSFCFFAKEGMEITL